MLLSTENAQRLAQRLTQAYPGQMRNWDERQSAALMTQLLSLLTGQEEILVEHILDPEVGMPGSYHTLSAYNLVQWLRRAAPTPPAYKPLPAPEPKDTITDVEKERVFAILQRIKMDLSVTTEEMKRCIDKDGKKMEKRPWYRPDVPKAQMDAMRLEALENLEQQKLAEEGNDEVPNV